MDRRCSNATSGGPSFRRSCSTFPSRSLSTSFYCSFHVSRLPDEHQKRTCKLSLSSSQVFFSDIASFSYGASRALSQFRSRRDEAIPRESGVVVPTGQAGTHVPHPAEICKRRGSESLETANETGYGVSLPIPSDCHNL